MPNLTLGAVPFQTGSDVDVKDHLKYMAGERLADQLDSVRFGHGLFSLLDAFPFQHPGAPELSVSIPALTPPAPSAAGRARRYGQGASGSFDNFTTLTISGSAGPASPSEIVSALAAAQG